jgi:hypothetical protein
MSFAVLRCWPRTNAVREDCFEPVVIGPRNIQPLVRNHSGKILPHPLPHDAHLAMPKRESLLEQDGGRMNRKALDAALKIVVP